MRTNCSEKSSFYLFYFLLNPQISALRWHIDTFLCNYHLAWWSSQHTHTHPDLPDLPLSYAKNVASYMLFLTYMDSLSSRAMVVIWPLVLLIFSQFAGSDNFEYLHTHRKHLPVVHLILLKTSPSSSRRLLEEQQLWIHCAHYGWKTISIISYVSPAPLKLYSGQRVEHMFSELMNAAAH